MKKLLVIPLIVIFALSVGTYAWAGPPTEQLRAYTDQVFKVLENPALTLPERRAAVRNLAAEAFDVSETAKRALGLHWQQRTPAEREEFVKLFANLLEQTYISRIDEYGGERITYVGEQIDGDRATVRAQIVTKKGGEVSVESRLLQKEDLGYIVRLRGDRMERRASPPEDWRWPLIVGRSWSSIVTWVETGEQEERRSLTAIWLVEAYEDVKTPAGTFKTFKVVRRELESGAVYEFWYSPAVKGWVKLRQGSRRHLRGGTDRLRGPVTPSPAPPQCDDLQQ